MKLPAPGSVTYRIRHTTRYRYASSVAIAHNEARLIPRDGPQQRAHSTRFVVEPSPSFMARELDYFGNAVNLFAFEEPHKTFSITAHSEVTVSSPVLPQPASTPPWEQSLARGFDPAAPGMLDAMQYVYTSPHVEWNEQIRAYALESFPSGRPLLEGAFDLTRRIYKDFKYEPGVTSIATPVSTVFRARRGVCQDFAHLQLACMRSLGLSARYVSGYLLTRPPPGKEKLVGADASHAWVSVFCPGYGFVDLDPTNDTVVGPDHTTLAWGRDFADVSPLRGVVLGGGSHTVHVAVDVTPVDPPAGAGGPSGKGPGPGPQQQQQQQ
ncbi:MAG: transglutaminase family protein [Myxococcales bacterium]|jgi:transglutaminase-like putative cysteine protease